jgi:cysteine synthase
MSDNFIGNVVDFKVFDEFVLVTNDREAFQECFKLAQTEGILVGPSTGCVLVGIQSYLNTLENEPIDSERRIQGPIVAIAADTGLKYTGSLLDLEFLDKHQIQHTLHHKTKQN